MMNRLFGLDALRGVAALLVLLFHAELWSDSGNTWSAGFLAVDLFFVLSGYVLTTVYEPRWAQGVSARSFMLARLRRLWLPFAIGCTIGLAYLLIIGFDVWRVMASYGLALLFLPTPFFPGHAFAINQPGWSLAFELIANLVHITVFARLTTRKIFRWFAVFAVGFVLAAFHNDGVFIGLTFEGFPSTFFRAMTTYLLGVLIARWKPSVSVDPWVAVAALPIVILALANVSELLRIIIFSLLLAPILVIISSHNIRYSKFAGALGALSYPLYSVHDPIILIAIEYKLPVWISIAISLAIAAAVAYVAPRGVVTRKVR
jgi:peptidoglycan/LPS O-acetylase OafA/YrhL